MTGSLHRTGFGRRLTTSLLALVVNGCSLIDEPKEVTLPIAWRQSSAVTSGGWTGRPLFTNGAVVHQGFEGRLYAFSPATGAPQWTSPRPMFDRPSEFIGSLSELTDVNAIILADRGRLSSFASATGAVGWLTVIDTQADIAYPTITHRGLLIGVGFRFEMPDNGFVYAVTSNGSMAWRIVVEDPAGRSTRPKAVIPFGASLLVVGSERGQAPVSDRGFVVAVDATTGAPQWRYDTADQRSVYYGGVIAADSILLLTNSGSGGIDAINLNTRQELWRVPGIASSLGSTQPPAVSGGLAYQGDKGGVVQAVDIRTGIRRWTARVDAGVTDVAACGDKLVVQHYAISMFNLTTGAFVGSWGTGDTSEFPTSSLAVQGSRVFVSGPKGFYAFDC